MVRHRTTDRYRPNQGEGESHRHTKGMLIRLSRPTFLVFDCIAINGVNYCKENLNERLGQIRERIVAPYRSSVEEGAIDSVRCCGLVLAG